MHKLEQQVAAMIQPLNATHFFVGSSGGLDSTVLIHCLNKLGKRVSIVHVNYQLRGVESEGDQLFLEELAKHLGMPCHVKRVNLSDQLKQNGGNLQNEARKLRRAYLNRFALKNGMYVALAHHADDQVETFIINLFRGGGIMGLAAMLPKHEKIVRPLLGCTRAEIMEYASLEGLNWREDSSNASTYYLRNRIRLEWLPLMEKQFPEFRENVLFLVQQFQQSQAELELRVGHLFTTINTSGKLSVESFSHLNEEEQLTLIRQLTLPIALHSELIKLVHADKGKRIPLVHEKWNAIVRETGHFFFQSIETENTFVLPVLQLQEVDELPATFTKRAIYLNPDQLNGILRVRTWKEGDRMSPVGLKTKSGNQGSKLIADILADAKVLHHEKARQLVVHDDEKILWCVGYAVGVEAIATKDSKKLKVELKSDCFSAAINAS
jgi:tRNA(Ile)-lysidine synthase